MGFGEGALVVKRGHGENQRISIIETIQLNKHPLNILSMLNYCLLYSF